MEWGLRLALMKIVGMEQMACNCEMKSHSKRLHVSKTGSRKQGGALSPSLGNLEFITLLILALNTI
jgi:hypothetical protein